MEHTYEDFRAMILRSQSAIFKKTTIFDSDALYGCTFENDKGYCEKIERAKQFCDNWDFIDLNACGLAIFGTPGTGKTFMAACIANELAKKGVSVRMTNCSRIIAELYKTEDKRAVLDELDRYDLLILDDFGAERLTPYSGEQVYNIIDSRYKLGRPLIITTNLTLEQLKKPENINAKRVLDRVWEMCTPVEVTGGSVRRKIAREKKEILRDIFSGSAASDADNNMQNRGGGSAGEREEKTEIIEEKRLDGAVSCEREDLNASAEVQEKCGENSGDNALRELCEKITADFQSGRGYERHSLTVYGNAAPAKYKGGGGKSKVNAGGVRRKGGNSRGELCKAGDKGGGFYGVTAEYFRSSA